MVDFVTPVLHSLRGAMDFKNTLRVLKNDTIRVGVIANNQFLEADGMLMHGYVVSTLQRKGFIPVHYSKFGAKRALFVNESGLSYNPTKLFSLVVDRLVPEPRMNPTGLIFQFIFVFFLFSLIGSILAIIGWGTIFWFIIVYMIFKIIVVGIKYAK